ncbi:hypothetical protein X946_3763 [Burkholderia sp. ABCPW 111]|nr:hypothetical protein X946_3763 [Burkholderia sp. ABCPW 111]
MAMQAFDAREKRVRRAERFDIGNLRESLSGGVRWRRCRTAASGVWRGVDSSDFDLQSK